MWSSKRVSAIVVWLLLGALAGLRLGREPSLASEADAQSAGAAVGPEDAHAEPSDRTSAGARSTGIELLEVEVIDSEPAAATTTDSTDREHALSTEGDPIGENVRPGAACANPPVSFSADERTMRRHLTDCKDRLQRSHWGYAEYFREPCFGSCLNQIMFAQRSAGEAALLVVHHYDFTTDTAHLTRRGRARLWRSADRMARFPYPLIVEESNRPELDEARRRAVIAELSEFPVTIAAENVIVGPPRSKGLLPRDVEPILSRLPDIGTSSFGSGGGASTNGGFQPTTSGAGVAGP